MISTILIATALAIELINKYSVIRLYIEFVEISAIETISNNLEDKTSVSNNQNYISEVIVIAIPSYKLISVFNYKKVSSLKKGIIDLQSNCTIEIFEISILRKKKYYKIHKLKEAKMIYHYFSHNDRLFIKYKVNLSKIKLRS